MAKEALTSKFTIVYGDDGIVRVKPKPGIIAELADVQLYYETCARLTGGHPAPFLVDSTEEYAVTREGQQYASDHSASRLATAVIVSSAFSKNAFNLYLRIFKPMSPMRMFTDVATAEEWLLTFLPAE